ncbi:hypothetical protein [Streptosporangium sp. LJ11]|uniref:hypothetical protein n=1 Tax=Streptosporangium sp. LJ11 TaxID=3436927 RepID=UPI003F7A2F7E
MSDANHEGSISTGLHAHRHQAVSCQRPRQDGDGLASERPAIVDAMNDSARTASMVEAIFSGDSA